jgi:hypothetical protein
MNLSNRPIIKQLNSQASKSHFYITNAQKDSKQLLLRLIFKFFKTQIMALVNGFLPNPKFAILLNHNYGKHERKQEHKMS